MWLVPHFSAPVTSDSQVVHCTMATTLSPGQNDTFIETIASPSPSVKQLLNNAFPQEYQKGENDE